MTDISDVLAMRVRLSALFLLVLALSCTRSRPDTPAVPVGPDSVDLGCPGLFKTWVSSSAGHGQPFIRFDWGDGDTSVWCGPGETARYSHAWSESGAFAVRAQARDDRAGFSEWSVPCQVNCVYPPYPYRITDSVALDGVELLDGVVLPDGKFVYVTDHDGTVWVVRTSSMRLVAQITVDEPCSSPQVLCSPDGEYVYTSEYRGCGVAVIRTADHMVVDSLMFDAEPTSIAISPDGQRLYVAVDADSGGLIVVMRVPGCEVEDTIPTLAPDSYVASMKVAPDGSRLYASDLGDDRVCAISLSDYALEWQAAAWGPAPGSIVVHPTGDYVYVPNQERVLVLESGTGTIVDSVQLPAYWSSGISPDGSYLYVTCRDSADNASVAVVRTSDNVVVRLIVIPGGACDVAPSPDGQCLYVAGGHALYVLGR